MSKRTSVIIGGLAVGVLIAIAAPAMAVVVTFEEGLGHNGDIINTQYTGITFQSAGSGIPWVYGDATTGLYNVSSWPSGQVFAGGNYWINDYVFTWTTESGNDGKISFNSADASYAQINYSSNSVFYMEAYNSANQLLGTASGPANLRYAQGNEYGPGTVRVDAPGIAYILLHDSGNYWCVDNLVTNAGGIVTQGDLQIVKFYDQNLDGLFSSGEGLLPGWQYLVEGPGGFSQTVTTGAGGSVTMDNLAPGQYTLTEIVKPGWTPTTANPYTVTVAQGSTSEAWFGNVPEPGTLSLLAVVLLTVFRRRSA